MRQRPDASLRARQDAEVLFVHAVVAEHPGALGRVLREGHPLGEFLEASQQRRCYSDAL